MEIILVVLLVDLGLAILTAVLAANRYRSAVGWFLLAVCFPIIALLVLLSLREGDPDRWAYQPPVPPEPRIWRKELINIALNVGALLILANLISNFWSGDSNLKRDLQKAVAPLIEWASPPQ